MDDLSIEDFSPVKSQKSFIPNRGSYVDEAPDGGIGGIGSSSTFDPLIGSIDNCDFPGAFRESIQEWTNKGNISFKYDNAKMKRSLADATKKMEKKKKDNPDWNQLECTQCKELFPDEGQLRLHYESKEHLKKVREKSESKTLGDLTTFAKLKFVSESPTHLNEASMPTSNEVSEKLFM